MEYWHKFYPKLSLKFEGDSLHILFYVQEQMGEVSI